MNSGAMLFFLLFIGLAVLLFNRERIFKPTKKDESAEDVDPETIPTDAEGFDFGDRLYGIYKNIEDIAGEDVILVYTVVFGILLLWWFIELIFRYNQTGTTVGVNINKFDSTPLYWMATLLTFLIAIFAIHQIFFKEDRSRIRPEVVVEINKLQVGGIVAVPMSLTTIAKVTIDMTKPRRDGVGKSFWACPEVLNPDRVKDFVFFEPLKKGLSHIHHLRISDVSKKHLLDYGVMQVEVKFTKMLAGNRLEDNPCPYLKY